MHKYENKFFFKVIYYLVFINGDYRAASDPGFNRIDDGIKFIYSNYYGKRTDLQYQFSWVTPETVCSTEKNDEGQDIIKLSTFDSQFIAFYSEEASEPNIKIETSSIDYINIDIYLSEKIDELNIKLHAPDSKPVYGYTVSTDNVGGELLPDSWHTLRIPLSEFEYVRGENQLEQINSIELTVVDKSGSSAKGQVTAYLDNIFFYKVLLRHLLKLHLFQCVKVLMSKTFTAQNMEQGLVWNIYHGALQL